MPEYAQGGYVGPIPWVRNDTQENEIVIQLTRGCAYFSPEAIERYGRKFLEELFPDTDIEEMPDAD